MNESEPVRDDDIAEPVLDDIAEDALVLWAAFEEAYHGKFTRDWANMTARERNAWRKALAEIRDLPVGLVGQIEEEI